ncbi:hypothetical protein D3C81_841940 [compost metagenome]
MAAKKIYFITSFKIEAVILYGFSLSQVYQHFNIKMVDCKKSIFLVTSTIRRISSTISTKINMAHYGSL